jgi:peptidoglycan/xylan/chitin deacetylase (PgdA/CDA1 family)
MRTARGRGRPVIALLAALLLTGTISIAPAVAANAMPVRFEAGPHVAVKFDSAWKVVATKPYAFSRPSSAPADLRTTVPGRGIHLRISAGLFAGYWVPEGRMSYVPGVVGLRTLSPAVAVAFPAGSYEAYRFDSTWALTSAWGRAMAKDSSAAADRAAVIDGRPYVRIVNGLFAGWWLPGTTSALQRITCVSGPKPTPTTATIVRSVPAATGRIALTFDMGGRLEPAMAILRFLELERICATIFPTGQMAQTTVGQQVMAEIKAHPELFELGNHTMRHCNLRDGGGGSTCPTTRPSDAFVVKELADAEAVFASLAGRTSTPYWRPPYGAVDPRLVTVAGSAGYPLTVMWSTDTIDWRPVADGGPTAWEIAKKVIDGRTAGGIVLMHLGGWNTRDALPAMLDGLLRAGYRPTTVSGLYR